jgi:UDP-N-acetylmuramoylalanine--D-glutamate ligase
VITAPIFAGKRYAVLGLARSGLATARALVESGAHVTAWDSREEARIAAIREIGAGLTLADPLEADLSGFAGVVVSPGVPINSHPITEKARAAGVPLIGDIELFAQARASLPAHKVVGITGTNGKSTTTALIYHLLTAAGIPATLGGNIGLPILGQDPLPEGGVYVLELSSYQIDLTFSLDCDIAILTNITPDHLDRYDGFEAYVASKLRLFAMQSAGHASIVAVDDALTASIAKTGDPRFNFPSGNISRITSSAVTKLLGQAEWPTLQGPHNGQNAALAESAARMLGVSSAIRFAALKTFPGLSHRMERIRTLNGVLYVNDSKATNATSAAPALAAYSSIHWILGGQAKSDELDACMEHFGHVRAAYTIGEAGPMFAQLLSPVLTVSECGILDEAVRRAHLAARDGDVVLFSPACASFDQFQDFEARGDAFRAAVEALV